MKAIQLISKWEIVSISKTSSALGKWLILGVDVSVDVKRNLSQYIALGAIIRVSVSEGEGSLNRCCRCPEDAQMVQILWGDAFHVP